MGFCCCGPSSVQTSGDGLRLTNLSNESKQSRDKRIRTWQATGSVSLRDSRLKELPKSVDGVQGDVRILDATNNQLTCVPFVVEGMKQLQRLVLPMNSISSFPISMSNLTKLKVLNLDSNQLSSLPHDLGSCKALERVSVQYNHLTSLPDSIGALNKMHELRLNHNKLTGLPATLRACGSLKTVELTDNQISDVPAVLAEVVQMRTLLLDSNQIASVPGELLTECQHLQTLSLHNTPITRQMLEATEGFKQFEQRRQAKYSKTITGGALMNSFGLDLGVDLSGSKDQ